MSNAKGEPPGSLKVVQIHPFLNTDSDDARASFPLLAGPTPPPSAGPLLFLRTVHATPRVPRFSRRTSHATYPCCAAHATPHMPLFTCHHSLAALRMPRHTYHHSLAALRMPRFPCCAAHAARPMPHVPRRAAHASLTALRMPHFPRRATNAVSPKSSSRKVYKVTFVKHEIPDRNFYYT